MQRNSETDVCLNVMFVAEAALTFPSPDFHLSELFAVSHLPESG